MYGPQNVYDTIEPDWIWPSEGHVQCWLVCDVAIDERQKVYSISKQAAVIDAYHPESLAPRIQIFWKLEKFFTRALAA